VRIAAERFEAMTTSLFDHPLLGQLVGDTEVADLFSLESEFQAIEIFEVSLAQASGKFDLISTDAVKAITEALDKFSPDLKALISSSVQDGLYIPELVAQMRAHVGEPHGQYLHYGATSQDVIDTSLALRLSKILPILERRLASVISVLEAHSIAFSGNRVMARTRMQNAIEIDAGDRIANWIDMLADVQRRLAPVRKAVLRVQLGGAAGTRDRFDGKGTEIADEMGKMLDLNGAGPVWHTNRVGIADLANWLSLVSGALGKIGMDMSLMANGAVAELKFSGGGKSSAMPHKQNPVGAEILVALARYNATQLSAMHQALVHENERSGAAWTLEWLSLPQMIMTTAGALNRADAICRQIQRIGA